MGINNNFSCPRIIRNNVHKIPEPTDGGKMVQKLSGLQLSLLVLRLYDNVFRKLFHVSSSKKFVTFIVYDVK